MKWTNCAAVLSGFVAICFAQLFVKAAPLDGAPSNQELDPTVLEDQAKQVLSAYCVSCHGPDKQEGEVQLGALETIDAVDRQALLGKMQDVVHLGEMPPEEAKQPSDAERKVLLEWLNSQLTGKAAKALAEKLQRFEYGNVVDHKDLFSGEYAVLPGYTPDRRWLISGFIFNEEINRRLN